jgi:hypothetical protein
MLRQIVIQSYRRRQGFMPYQGLLRGGLALDFNLLPLPF